MIVPFSDRNADFSYSIQGYKMTTEETEPSKSETHPADNEWERRILCSDDSCTGTIGNDGHCRVCGRAYEGDAVIPADHLAEEDTDTQEPFPEDEPVDGDEEGRDADQSETLVTSTVDWDDRELCSDESCVGTLGPDGRCRVCGKKSYGKKP